jgi:hypothetical protein
VSRSLWTRAHRLDTACFQLQPLLSLSKAERRLTTADVVNGHLKASRCDYENSTEEEVRPTHSG